MRLSDSPVSGTKKNVVERNAPTALDCIANGGICYPWRELASIKGARWARYPVARTVRNCWRDLSSDGTTALTTSPRDPVRCWPASHAQWILLP